MNIIKFISYLVNVKTDKVIWGICTVLEKLTVSLVEFIINFVSRKI